MAVNMKCCRWYARMTARQCWGAIFEPNLRAPIITGLHAKNYAQQIREVTEAVNEHFKPYVLLYQTDTLDPMEVANALNDGFAFGTKFYPRGATTNSHNGIADVSLLWTPGTRPYEVLRAVGAAGRVRQLHCELNFDLDGNELDPYEKEPYFFKEIMPRLLDAHPDGKWSCEHLTTAEGAAFMRKHGGPNLGCSITPHHLLFDRRDMFRGGLRPHLYCLPVIQPSEHLEALLDLVHQNLPFVYAGSDSAPHDRRKKECDCCSGGRLQCPCGSRAIRDGFRPSWFARWRSLRELHVDQRPEILRSSVQ